MCSDRYVDISNFSEDYRAVNAHVLEPYLTKDDEKRFNNNTECEYCGCQYTDKNPKVRHHNYTIHPQFSEDKKEVIKR